MFLVRFWGVRGSIPVPGPTTVEVGGNTTCVEVRAGSEIIIFDAGTGLRELGCELMAELPVSVKLFFTHVHWDHIQGFPFFAPAFGKGNRFDLYGGRKVTASLSEILSGQMEFPNFPVSLDAMGSRMHFHDLHEGEIVSAGGATVTNTNLNHPGGVIAYRVDYQGHSVVFATDTEHYSCLDEKLVNLARGRMCSSTTPCTPRKSTPGTPASRPRRVGDTVHGRRGFGWPGRLESGAWC